MNAFLKRVEERRQQEREELITQLASVFLHCFKCGHKLNETVTERTLCKYCIQRKKRVASASR